MDMVVSVVRGLLLVVVFACGVYVGGCDVDKKPAQPGPLICEQFGQVEPAEGGSGCRQVETGRYVRRNCCP